jgi:hypothetical protein
MGVEGLAQTNGGPQMMPGAMRGAEDTPLPELLIHAVGGGWAQLPAWGSYLAAIGSIAAEPAPSCRSIIAVSLPTRAYAAALVTLGALSRASTGSGGDDAGRGHLLELQKAAPGTAVTLFDYGVQKGGTLEGLVDIDATSYFRIKLKSMRNGGDTRLVPTDQARRIHLSSLARDAAGRALNVEGQVQTGAPRAVKARYAFIKALYPDLDVLSFSGTAFLEVLIVGSAAAMRPEVTGVELAVLGSAGRPVSGSFLDAIRTRGVLPTGQPYRSAIVRPASISQIRTTPGVVICDGAGEYLRTPFSERPQSLVILLDRSRALLDEAVQLINSDYARRASTEHPLDHQVSPPGIEVTAYYQDD